MSDTFLIATRERVPHANGAPGDWWVEYRVRPATDDERWRQQRHWQRHCLSVLDVRYCHQQDSEYCTVHLGNWQAYEYGATPFEAALNFRGDTWFAEADSCHPIHVAVRMVVECERQRARRVGALLALTHIEMRDWNGNPMSEELDVTGGCQEDAHAEFERELKRRRLYSKAMNGKAPAAIVDAIKAEVMVTYRQRVAARLAEHAAWMAELKELEAR